MNGPDLFQGLVEGEKWYSQSDSETLQEPLKSPVEIMEISGCQEAPIGRGGNTPKRISWEITWQ